MFKRTRLIVMTGAMLMLATASMTWATFVINKQLEDCTQIIEEA